MHREAGARVRPQRARVRRGHDDAATRAVAVTQAALEERAPVAARLRVRMDDEQREAPDPLAQDRERRADRPAVLLRHPRAAGIGLDDVAEAPLDDVLG